MTSMVRFFLSSAFLLDTDPPLGKFSKSFLHVVAQVSIKLPVMLYKDISIDYITLKTRILFLFNNLKL